MTVVTRWLGARLAFTLTKRTCLFTVRNDEEENNDNCLAGGARCDLNLLHKCRAVNVNAESKRVFRRRRALLLQNPSSTEEIKCSQYERGQDSQESINGNRLHAKSTRDTALNSC